MSITVMKQALEALELVLETDEKPKTEINKAITSLRQAIAEAEKQEPIAIVDSTISGHIDWLCTVFPKQGTKLYTHPQPKREPLTDEQIETMWQEYCKQWKTGEKIVIQFVDFARAIEAAHGIKGEA